MPFRSVRYRNRFARPLDRGTGAPTGGRQGIFSSSRLRQANGPIPFVWWPGSSDRAGPSGCGKMISGAVGFLPTRSVPTCCSWPISHRPSWVVISPLGWPLPERVLDLYVEFRRLTNGLDPYCGNGLLGALAWHGLDAMDAAEKESMRKLAMRGGPWSEYERRALLAYCESDVRALAKLLPAMLPELDLPRAVACRGRYMGAVARMEWAGVPIDTETLSRLRAGWESIQDRLIRIGRLPVRRVRRPDVQGRALGRLVGPVGYLVAQVRVRGVGAGR